MYKVNYLEIENIDGIPVMHITIERMCGEIGVCVKRGYLAPFRGYCFQVSGTKDGSGDMGSSKVIGLKHCLEIAHKDGHGFESNYGLDGVSKQLLLGQVLIALTKWSNDLHVDLGSWDLYHHSPNQMTKFIDECYEYLRTL